MNIFDWLTVSFLIHFIIKSNTRGQNPKFNAWSGKILWVQNGRVEKWLKSSLAEWVMPVKCLLVMFRCHYHPQYYHYTTNYLQSFLFIASEGRSLQLWLASLQTPKLMNQTLKHNTCLFFKNSGLRKSINLTGSGGGQFNPHHLETLTQLGLKLLCCRKIIDILDSSLTFFLVFWHSIYIFLSWHVALPDWGYFFNKWFFWMNKQENV